jgi:SAM-dependent methyltransferase
MGNATKPPMTICSLCGHTQFDLLFDKGFTVLLCRYCALVFVADIDKDYRKYYTEEYTYKLSNGSHFVEDKKRDQCLFKWIAKNLPSTEDLSLLEIGSGPGFLLKRFKDYGIKVFGLEPGKKAAAFAKRLVGSGNIACCMLEDIDDTQTKYDIIILVQTFEHFSDPLKSLLAIRSLLAADGLLFIEVPNYYAPYGFYRFKTKGANCPSPNHLFVYTPKTLSAFLGRAGFSVYRISYAFSNIRIIARLDSHGEPAKCESYRRVMVYFRMLPMLHRAVDLVHRFLRRHLLI